MQGVRKENWRYCARAKIFSCAELSRPPHEFKNFLQGVVFARKFILFENLETCLFYARCV